MCAVPWCLAEGDANTGLCVVHIAAKRLERVMVGDRCVRCRQPLKVGDWLTRESTLTEGQHLVCPPAAAARARKRDGAPSLFDCLRR